MALEPRSKAEKGVGHMARRRGRSASAVRMRMIWKTNLGVVGSRKWFVNFRLLPHTFENKMREEEAGTPVGKP